MIVSTLYGLSYLFDIVTYNELPRRALRYDITTVPQGGLDTFYIFANETKYINPHYHHFIYNAHANI